MGKHRRTGHHNLHSTLGNVDQLWFGGCMSSPVLKEINFNCKSIIWVPTIAAPFLNCHIATYIKILQRKISLLKLSYDKDLLKCKIALWFVVNISEDEKVDGGIINRHIKIWKSIPQLFERIYRAALPNRIIVCL